MVIGKPEPCRERPDGPEAGKIGAAVPVATEMALHVLAYNMTRVTAILGVPGLIEPMQA